MTLKDQDDDDHHYHHNNQPSSVTSSSNLIILTNPADPGWTPSVQAGGPAACDWWLLLSRQGSSLDVRLFSCLVCITLSGS